MSFLSTASVTLRHLHRTVHAQYGRGVAGYSKFVYYSFLRTNIFIVFVHDCCDSFDKAGLSSRLKFIRNDFEELNSKRVRDDLPKEFYCDQTHHAQDFLLGLWEEKAAYIHWIFLDGTQTRFLNLGGGCAEICYMMTLPDFRGQRICSQAIAHTVQVLSSEGVRKVFCVVHDKNIASIKAVLRAGLREFARVRSIGPFNTRLEVTA